MRTPWCTSYFSLMPRRIEMVSSTVGSLTKTGWKRRASAASFSICLRYSSSVVAPMQCSSPRASAGLSMLEASMDPSALPAPTSVCISSMKRMISPAEVVTSFSTALSRSSNSPRYFAPAISAPMSSASSRLSCRLSGTSPLTIRKASPSAIAVLPTPGSPIRTGLFFVRRLSTCMVRRISSSRPMIGSILPSRAASVRSRVYFFSASYCCSALALSAVRPLRRSLIAAFRPCAVTPAAFRASLAPDFVTASAVSSRSTVTKLSPAWLASFSASASTFAVWVSTTMSPPSTRGSLASARSTAARAAAASPPARAIRFAASPWSSSSSAFSRCSGRKRWWFSLSAIVCPA